MALQTKTISSLATANGYTLNLLLTEKSIDVNSNLSPIDYTLILKSGSANFAQYKIGWSISLNGSVVSFKSKSNANQREIGKNSSLIIASGSTQITHDPDGTKKMAVAFSIDMDKVYYTPGAISVSGQSMTLTTIPRATKPTLPNSIEMGKKITVTLPRASSNFTHELSYSFGTVSGVIGKNYGASAEWSIPISLAEQVPSAKSGNGTIICKTYNGSTLIGTVSVPFTANVPNTVVPTISEILVSETVNGIFEHFSGFVQSKSKLRIKTVAAGVYKSKILSIKVSFDGKEYIGDNIVTEPPSSSENLSVTVIATDSRGRTASLTQPINIIPYFSPTVNSFSAERADTTGLIDDEGEYMAYKADYSISDINNLNSAIFQIQYKQTDATEWNVLLTETEFSNILSGVSEQEILNADETFNVRFMVQDFFGTVYFYTPEIPSAFTLVDYDDSGKGISFGGVCREKGMHTFLPTTFYDTLQVKNENTYKIFFAPGDTFTLTTSSFSACAYITSSAHDLIVQIPVLKPICASSVTAEGIIIARGVNGYINGTSWETADISLSGGAGYTILYTITDTGIVITFTFDNTITNATNNTPVAVTVKNNVTFTFS